MFDFSTATIDSPLEGGMYVSKPGFYFAKVTDVVLTKPEDTTKNPYLTISFETETEEKVSDKFYITQKALGRLKALFKGVWNKEMTQVFKSADEVADFFKTALLKKQQRIGIRVLLEKSNNGKFYARLPFFDFISFDLDKFESRVVETTDSDYLHWIQESRTNTPPKNDSTLVEKPSESWTSATEGSSTLVDESDDLPF